MTAVIIEIIHNGGERVAGTLVGEHLDEVQLRVLGLGVRLPAPRRVLHARQNLAIPEVQSLVQSIFPIPGILDNGGR